MDFTKITKKILDSGLTEQQLAKKLKVSQPTINRIKNNPNYNLDYKVGAALIRISKDMKGRKQLDVNPLKKGIKV